MVKESISKAQIEMAGRSSALISKLVKSAGKSGTNMTAVNQITLVNQIIAEGIIPTETLAQHYCQSL